MPRIMTVGGHTPRISEGAFVAPDVTVAGDVSVADGASIWFGCVVRSEKAAVVIGPDSNLQDLSVIHTDTGYPTTIGARVTVGHRVVLHGCTVGDDALVGMGAVVLNGAVIGEGAVVAAGAVVREGDEIPPMRLAVGVPARVLDHPVPGLPRPNVANYLALSELYRAALDG